MNKNIYYSVTLGTLIITGLLLLGVMDMLFGIKAETNLFNTGITPGGILGIILLVIAVWVYKRWV